VGVNYSYTSFDRSGYGPWHLGSIQYRERSWGSLIGRINYVNRLSSGISVSDGMLEAESYFSQEKRTIPI
jgi:hypothetical protein